MARLRTIAITTTHTTTFTNLCFGIVSLGIGFASNGRHMGFIKQRLERAVFGDSDIRVAGQMRTLRGLREGDNRELLIGLGLAALAYMRKSQPKRDLIYRKAVTPGSALVIHHKRRGTPRLEIIKPPKRG